jgi:ATP-dependent Clp protease ATP-binding subunit ClpC
LDEIEKAHPDVFNILLQVLEDGHLTDNLGHTVSFRNTVVIMTSNIGAREIFQGKSLGFRTDDAKHSYEKMKERVTSEMKKVFSPEFLNRVDEVIVFHPLGEEEIRKIIELMINQLNERLGEQGIKINLTEEAFSFIAKKGFDPAYGARPLRRTIQRYIEDPLAEEVLKEKGKREGEIVVNWKENEEKLNFEWKKEKKKAKTKEK